MKSLDMNDTYIGTGETATDMPPPPPSTASLIEVGAYLIAVQSKLKGAVFNEWLRRNGISRSTAFYRMAKAREGASRDDLRVTFTPVRAPVDPDWPEADQDDIDFLAESFVEHLFNFSSSVNLGPDINSQELARDVINITPEARISTVTTILNQALAIVEGKAADIRRERSFWASLPDQGAPLWSTGISQDMPLGHGLFWERLVQYAANDIGCPKVHRTDTDTIDRLRARIAERLSEWLTSRHSDCARVEELLNLIRYLRFELPEFPELPDTSNDPDKYTPVEIFANLTKRAATRQAMEVVGPLVMSDWAEECEAAGRDRLSWIRAVFPASKHPIAALIDGSIRTEGEYVETLMTFDPAEHEHITDKASPSDVEAGLGIPETVPRNAAESVRRPT